MRAVRITEFGGPEVVAVHEVPDPQPAPGQTLLHVSRCGVNFADTLLRENAYLTAATLPLVPGSEVVGRTEDGRRLAAMIESGGYAEKVVLREDATFPVPDGVDDVAAVALLIQGLTAWWLINHTSRLRSGESVVVHAAAGGVGSLAVQLAKLSGAGRVIATAGTPEKRELALSLGADAVVDPAAEDLTAALCAANHGEQVDVVLEMTGGPVTGQSIAALAPFGRLAYYGMASQVEPEKVAPRDLQRRSLTVSGFWLMNAFAQPVTLAKAYAELAAQVVAGELRVINGGDHPMSEIRRVHEELRSRRTTGKLVIDPSR
ncbi:quinone oxidoreductase family protein [Nonomuraea aurantiaca]|uniref:quinone oxidoreductase family protein n=1 Tax=Nonomuraea aurantiaca TaxID=2878562 RepID=UPI001CD9826F|nr:zinc-binding dehydrogenase [Nonomuraea aurantiaca]MCA2229621.1 zinc-binding dehydrogenase [Nonomuraea aurantiaca]